MLDQLGIGQITCLRSSDGVTLFTRSACKSKALPIQRLVELGNLSTYANSHDCKINFLDTQNLKIIWKIYDNEITLILVDEIAPIDKQVYIDKLDMIFDSLVIMYGRENLTKIVNPEKFKNEIRLAYNLIDSVLDNTGKYDLFGGHLTNSIDILQVDEANLFQDALNKTCEQTNIFFGCLMMNGRIIVASQSWLELKPSESYLVSLLGLTLSGSTCCDVPIFLPQKSPNIISRLLTYNLTNNIILCLICSDVFAVDSAEQIIKGLWHPIYKSLVNLKQYIPRNLPTSISLDFNMIGFLLVNKKLKRCISSLCPNEKIATHIQPEIARQRFKILKYCYLNMSTNFFYKFTRGHSANPESNEELTCCTEAYTLLNKIKCYAIVNELYEFFAIYNSNIPTYAMRGVTRTCLGNLHTLFPQNK